MKNIFKNIFASAAKTAAKSATEKALTTATGKSVYSAVSHFIAPATKSVCKSSMGRSVCDGMVRQSIGKGLRGAALRSTANKVASTNFITGTVVTTVSSIGDINRYCKGEISGGQLAKNVVANGAEVAGGFGGSAAGAAAGTAICPVIGTAIGWFVGGLIGGSVCKSATKHIID